MPRLALMEHSRVAILIGFSKFAFVESSTFF
jgi:hypothetical protein